MMKLLNWHGVACIDIRRDARTNAIYVLEINGRFWASVAPSYVKAGVNFPVILARLSLGEQVALPKQKEAKQISLHKYIELKKAGQKVSFSETKFMAYFDDPIARLMQLAWR
jgi:predicted ATP-grasp superfamily ATP-dependent carboligase